MLYTICYFSALVSVVIIFIRYKLGIMSVILLAEQAVIAFFAILCIKENLIPSNQLRIWPYLLLAFSGVVCCMPFVYFQKRHSENAEFDVDINILRIFAIVYIFLTFFAIATYWPHVKELLISQEWGANRDYRYDNEFVVANNIFEWIGINSMKYLSVPAIMTYFILECKNEYSGVRYALLFAIIIGNFMRAMDDSSRGIILDFFLLLVSAFFAFSRWMPKRNKRKLYMLFGTLGVVALIFGIAVTTSRFDKRSAEFGENSSFGSLIYYFGQSPVVFNNNVSHADNPLLGLHMFGVFFPFLGIPDTFSQALTGTWWSTWFYTYVGYFYVDYGLLGTIIIIVCLSYCIYRLTDKQNISLSSLCILFYFYSFIQKGLFVIGRTYIIEYAIYAVIIILIKLTEMMIQKSKRKSQGCRYFLSKNVYIGDNMGLIPKHNDSCKYIR